MHHTIDGLLLRDQAKTWRESLVRQYRHFRDHIEITRYELLPNWALFWVKPKGDTSEQRIRKHAPDVQLRMKVRNFQVLKRGSQLFLALSDRDPSHEELVTVLGSDAFHTAISKMQLPFVAGFDVTEEIVIEDLAEFPHLLIAGSTNAGKTVCLKSLITSLIFCRTPSQVNFVVIDIGAADLCVFAGLPHLSCPVIQSLPAAIDAIAKLVAEMNRRVRLSPAELLGMPRLMVIIDEFPALFAGQMSAEDGKKLVNSVSSLLQRGRHAKIHIVLAAQNPTARNMKVDLGNITARVALRCAKRNFSDTIIGMSGAEHLAGKGDLLFVSPLHDDAVRLQGTYISPEDLQLTVEAVKNYRYLPAELGAAFRMSLSPLSQPFSHDSTAHQPVAEENLQAQAAMWAFERGQISVNALQERFHLGWNAASRLMEQLEQRGIVNRLSGKLPRVVLPQDLGDIPPGTIELLESNGFSKEDVLQAFDRRRSG